ncbi:hypothetical protein K457DRAFT_26278 [Linnemannia elongata AG-77]|uniref:Tc1-like transposase DDE domain-containing protein n=1 Tax=Linnemannia elongata AG-77 TaxID=1314771 RepID=A0A197JCJ3_9FUNG|nr:hypothetical protein K457DRAFT_26278 [Linnemannia elongata AG-77]
MLLLVALDSTGLIASEVKIRAYNGVYFARFLMNKLFPKLPGPRTIIRDNCRIYKTPSVKKAFTLLQPSFLPLIPLTLSPAVAIAEWAFSCIKGHAKKKSAQRYNLAGCIQKSLQRSVTATKTRGWLKEVGCNFQLARANMPLGRFMNAKQALCLMERGSDPYPEVERDDMEGEDQVEEEKEIGELDEVWKEKEPFYESSSHSSDSSEDEANEEENGTRQCSHSLTRLKKNKRMKITR